MLSSPTMSLESRGVGSGISVLLSVAFNDCEREILTAVVGGLQFPDLPHEGMLVCTLLPPPPLCSHRAAGAARPAPGNTDIQGRETVMRGPGSYVYQLMSAWTRVCCWDMALVPGEEHLEIHSDDGLGGALAVSTDHLRYWMYKKKYIFYVFVFVSVSRNPETWGSSYVIRVIKVSLLFTSPVQPHPSYTEELAVGKPLSMENYLG